MYSPLNTEMYTLYVESRLAGPLSGNIIIEVNPREKVSNIIHSYLTALQNEGGMPGLAVYDNHYRKLDWNATIESQGIQEGTKLYIGHDRSNLFKPVHIKVIGMFTIIIACVLFIVTSVLFGATGGNVPFDYGIVIDAGSTHTQIFLYQWSGSKYHGTGNVHQRESCEYEAGIASGIDPVNILSCVNNVTKSVPKGSLPVLYLGATAGMRILYITNPKDANLILMSLKYALLTSPVEVKTVSIIQGEEEALFSWITTNFLTHTFNQTKVKSTYGALDLGGASTQYAFAVYNESLKNESDISAIKLYGYEYNVKAISYLCFGYMEAMDRLKAVMLMENSSSTLNDPCSPVGYIEHINVSSFSEKPCISNPQFNAWLRKNLISDELIINGAGNYTECKKNVLNVINETACLKSGFKQCLPNTNLRELNMNFTAFSGFYYVVHYLNGSNSLDDFINSTQNWCSLTWEEIQRTHPKIELVHILRYCFASTYIIELLTSKYGFDSSTWNRIDFTQKIENADIGWALGYMINATNAIPEELPSPPVISLSVFIPLAILSLAMISIAVIIIKMYVGINYCHGHSLLLEA